MNATRDDAAQRGFAYRFGWGLDALHTLAPEAAVVVVVDVLRFTTAVCAALEAGATVLPFRWKDDRAPAFAAEHGALLAGNREAGGPSLSPTDLLRLPRGTRIVLPSPNGSAISFEAGELGVECVLASCLRNASAVARYAATIADGRPVAVIAGGEGWHDQVGLRPALEDLLGAGAVLRALDPAGAAGPTGCSPDARAARAAFVDARPALHAALCATASGIELTRIGMADDVATASEYDIARVVPRLVDHEFVPATR